MEPYLIDVAPACGSCCSHQEAEQAPWLCVKGTKSLVEILHH